MGLFVLRRSRAQHVFRHVPLALLTRVVRGNSHRLPRGTGACVRACVYVCCVCVCWLSHRLSQEQLCACVCGRVGVWGTDSDRLLHRTGVCGCVCACACVRLCVCACVGASGCVGEQTAIGFLVVCACVRVGVCAGGHVCGWPCVRVGGWAGGCVCGWAGGRVGMCAGGWGGG